MIIFKMHRFSLQTIRENCNMTMHNKQLKIWKTDRGIFQYIITKIIQKKKTEKI